MKNYEVGIIVVAVGLIGFLWWKNSGVAKTGNPTNSTSKGFMGPIQPGGCRSCCGAII